MMTSCSMLPNGLVISSNLKNKDNNDFSKFTQEELFRKTSQANPKLSIRKVRIVLRSYQKCFLKYIEQTHYIDFSIPELATIKIRDTKFISKQNNLKKIQYDDDVLINMINLETGEKTSIIKLIIENYYQNLVSSFYTGYRANFLSLLYLRFDNNNNNIKASAGSKLLKMRKDNSNLKIKVHNIREGLTNE